MVFKKDAWCVLATEVCYEMNMANTEAARISNFDQKKRLIIFHNKFSKNFRNLNLRIPFTKI